ncbi:MAG: hypothetical protein HF314_08105 [Ignavibacteria bacterium]|nr:hypothetical protein [Ignavibacteria bacterium]MCU7516559.1 hypothetical protein [Ignavibacteria bacterium]
MDTHTSLDCKHWYCRFEPGGFIRRARSGLGAERMRLASDWNAGAQDPAY